MAEVVSLPSGAPKLALRELRSGYGPIDVVRGVSIDVMPGRVFALLGKNGMGKTTLLKTILGLVPQRAGSVSLDGQVQRTTDPARLVRAGVAYAPQELPLFQDLSIRDNLRLALPSGQPLAPALDALSRYFPFLADRLTQRAGTLSGGEQKMLVLGRALMLRPSLLLVDEISEGLQPSVVDRVAEALLTEQAANGMTILIVEQNLDFALRVADEWAVIKQGEIDDSGTVDSNSRSRILEHLKI
jgi:branched-chain amino acid transport system ATP-binding protein